MKTLVRVLGVYQLLLSAFSLVFLIVAFIVVFRSDPDVHIHWFPMVCVILLCGTGAGICAVNGVRWIAAGSTRPLVRWKGLTPISILFTVLLTLIGAAALARTDWRSVSQTRLTSQEHPLLWQKAPGFSAIDISGHAVDSSNLIGRYVLLDFWASWCSPCVNALPDVQRARETFPEDKLAILGISRDQDIGSLKSFLARHDYTFTHIFDDRGEISALYSVSAIPMNFLIDPNGTIVAANMRGRTLLAVLSSHMRK